MKHCLIVDDSRVVRTIARYIIKDLTFETSEASNGVEALEKCAARMPDAVLLDCGMPVMNSIRFLCLLRQQKNGDHPVVILCVNENDGEYIGEALRAGANACIMKPFDAGVLVEKFSETGLLA